MRVTYNLPPEVISAVEWHAKALGVSKDAFVAERLSETSLPPVVKMRVGAMVRDGMCDADIAETLRYSPGRIAEIRRGLGLPANRRYKKH